MAKKKSGIWRDTLRSLVDIPQWLGYEWLVYPFAKIVNQAKNFFIPQEGTSTETFEEAIARLNLQPADLFFKARSLRRLAGVFLTLALLVLTHALYLFWSTAFFGGAFSIILAMGCLAFAFRYHFWAFQINSRKLGCTIEEWWFSYAKGPRSQ